MKAPAEGGGLYEVDHAYPWWRDADVVYVASLLFPEATMDALTRRLALLRPGARVLTLRRLPPRATAAAVELRPEAAAEQQAEEHDGTAAFREENPTWQQMSWGKAEVFQYRRL